MEDEKQKQNYEPKYELANEPRFSADTSTVARAKGTRVPMSRSASFLPSFLPAIFYEHARRKSSLEDTSFASFLLLSPSVAHRC